jgi:Flp pilus assembly protein TadD
MKLFPAWDFDAEVTAAADGGAAAVDDWFREKDQELGTRFLPAWFDMGVAASALAREGNTAAAVAVMRNLLRYHPDNAHVASFAAGVYQAAGKTDKAATEYRRAIELAQAQGLHPNALHLDPIRERLSQLEGAQ